MPMNLKVKFRVSMAWWWKLYCFGICFASGLTRQEPDWDKVNAVAKRALRVKVLTD
jgi:hypothetical protein